MDKTVIKDCVRVRNNLRATAQPATSNMRYVTWDAALARTARAWANKCIFKHNVYFSEKHQCHPNFTSIGENIWVGSHQAFCVADAIKLWYNEVRFCVFTMQKHSKACGHYTQVRVTFNVLSCLTSDLKLYMKLFFFLCSGNFPRRPYIEGKSCTNCAKRDTCENTLLCIYILQINLMFMCLFIAYSRWHPPLEFSFICDEVCISLVVLRELLMFLSSVAVYFIKKHFTNMPMST
ncbi:unnamed protein product [Bubo scandiacus]